MATILGILPYRVKLFLANVTNSLQSDEHFSREDNNNLSKWHFTLLATNLQCRRFIRIYWSYSTNPRRRSDVADLSKFIGHFRPMKFVGDEWRKYVPTGKGIFRKIIWGFSIVFSTLLYNLLLLLYSTIVSILY